MRSADSGRPPRRHRPAALLRALLTLTASGVAGGLLLAGALFPVAALGGGGLHAMAATFEALPAQLRVPATAQTTRVLAADGSTLLAAFFTENRHDVPLSAVAPVMAQAMVAAEDIRFYQHGGVDWRGVLRSLVADAGRGAPAQGASTLTMQYVRNVLKDDPSRTPAQQRAATADSPARKLQEIRYAAALERRMSKQEILGRYLNIAYFGDGAYGIDAASRTYFDVPPDRLTTAQAALLAGLVQSPDTDNPVTGDRAAATARRAYVLSAMVRAHDLTDEQAAAAGSEPLGLHPQQPRSGCVDAVDAVPGWGFFCGYLRQWWDRQAAFGPTPAARDRALLQGGYTVVTSLDPRVQAEALRRSLSVYGYDDARALPIAVVAPGTGRILAMAVNRRYSLAANPGGGHSRPNTVDQLVAGGDGVTGYPAGSTFKLFTMLAALDQGLPLDTGFDSPSPVVTRWRGTGPGSCGGYWCPSNDNPSWMDGYRTMWDGFGRSVNTYFVQLEQRIGPRQAVAMAQRLGITFRAASDARLAAAPDDWGTFTLGVSDTTPLDLAEAYATLGADGRYCQPLPVTSVTDRNGASLPVAAPHCTQAVSPAVAHAAADAARCPVGGQSAFGRCDGGTAPAVTGILGGRPVVGKTGSSAHNVTETFVGVTGQVAAAGIAADPADPRDAVGSAASPRVSAAVAATIAAAVAGQPWVDFPAPDQTMAYGG